MCIKAMVATWCLRTCAKDVVWTISLMMETNTLLLVLPLLLGGTRSHAFLQQERVELEKPVAGVNPAVLGFWATQHLQQAHQEARNQSHFFSFSVPEDIQFLIFNENLARHTGMIAAPKTAVDASCGVPVTLNAGQTATFKSENYPRRYPNNHYCEWTFETGDSDALMDVVCTKFKLKKSTSCDKDSMAIFDGDSLVQKFCGKEDGLAYSSTSNRLRIVFETDSRKKASGFTCTVKAKGSTTSMGPNVEDGCRNCGAMNRAHRIVGGQETDVNEYPWMAGLVIAGGVEPFCGGALLDDLHVITAAHCVYYFVGYENYLEVRLGVHNVFGSAPVQQQVGVASVIVHEDYNSNYVNYDMALLVLASPVELNAQVLPICLPTAAQNFETVGVVVTGWGLTSEGGEASPTLQEVELQTVTDDACAEAYNAVALPDDIICAGVPEGGKDSCQGDSGGPMVTEVDGNWVLVGLVSFGYGCARPGYPGGYTRVTYFLDWLEWQMQGGENNLCLNTGTTTPTSSVTTETPSDCMRDCGRANTRIVGGTDTDENEYPWQAGLVYKGWNYLFCGGSLYDKRHIITAAHCAEIMIDNPSNFEVLLGHHNLTEESASLQRIAVSKATIHPNYNNYYLDNDIAILRLASDAQITQEVRPVCMPDSDNDYSSVDAVVTGWGRLAEGGSTATILQEVTVPTMTNDDCSSYYGFSIPDNMICAGYPQGGKDACSGDSGGPMVTLENDRYLLIGVVSWGRGCARPNAPGVFARVSKFVSWIETEAGTEGTVCPGVTDATSSPQAIASSTQDITSSTQAPITPTSMPGDAKCGQINRYNRIVGGVETEVNEYPWQIALRRPNYDGVRCGGSIISEQWILTAAHCVDGVQEEDLVVTVGEHHLTNEGETAATETIRIAQIVVHPDYNPRNLDNDIALLKLVSNVVFDADNLVAPVCLPPNQNNDYVGAQGTVTGWGTQSSGGPSSSVLMEVTVPVLSNSECSPKVEPYAITDNMLCGGLAEGGKDSCQGDSGGPMVTEMGTSMIQIGIVSWGLGCAAPDKPGIYTRVTNYLPWIAGYTNTYTP